MTSIVRLDPFRELLSFRPALDRLFDTTGGHPGSPLAAWGSTPLDLCQTANEAVVKPSLPKVTAKDLNISITSDVLTLRDEEQAEEDVEGPQYNRKERRHSSFTRSIGLPTAVVADRADPQFDNGILTLRLPKAEEVKPKTITVKAR
jgi:HSP20 family protein